MIMRDSIFSLRLLKSRIATMEGAGPRLGAGFSAMGNADVDRALGGGLARGRLHELFALEADDAAGAAGFAAMLARQLGNSLVWLREERTEHRDGGIHAAGLAQMGVDPATLVLAVLPDALAVLRAAADVLRCPEAGAAIIELWGNPPVLDLTASRRLALAAESSGVTAFMLRVAARPTPSAAHTRWRIGSAPSRPLEANAPGHPALEVELLRQRGNAAGGPWQLEWDREQAIFRNRSEGATALSGAVVPLPVRRPAGGGDGVIPLRRAG